MPVKINPLPSKAFLNEMFDYAPDTGLLIWKKEVSKKRLLGKEAGSVHSEGYRVVRLFGARFLVHRVIWKMVTGEDPEEIDHIDGQRNNNKLSNLRSVPHCENHKNLKRLASNTTGVSGVTFHKSTNKWMARIRVNRKQIYLGVFDKLEDAIAARKAAEVKYGFHKNHGRN